MLNFESVSLNMGILKNSKNLIKVRLFLYTSAMLHLAIVSFILLNIDFDQYDDPDIQLYEKIKYKLFTAWFNLFNVVYLPASIYCEWQGLKGQQERRHVKLLNQARDLCFTSILLPITTFGDVLFWRMWNKDHELLAPPSIHQVVPFWTQHCMHTVSLVVVLLDLVLVRRERPKNNIPNVIMTCTFLLAYTYVCVDSCMNGVYVYPVLKLLPGIKFPLLIAYAFIEVFFYYTSQWFIVNMVWGQGNTKKIA